MQEAKRILLADREAVPICASRFEQRESADDVRLHEFAGPVDRTVYVAFSREMQHGARPVCSKQRIERRAIANIGMHKNVARIRSKRRQRFGIAA